MQEKVLKLAESIYQQLCAENLDVALDAIHIAKVLTRERLIALKPQDAIPQVPSVSA